MIRYFILHPIVTNLVFLILVVAGAAAWRNLPVESFPQISFGVVSVTTVWPDATAEDIEDQITTKIEEKVAEVDSVYRLTAFSEPGLSRVEIKFDENLQDEDYWELLMDVQSKLREVQDLPAEARPPVAVLIDIQDWKPALEVVLSGPIDERVLQDAADQMKRELSSLYGVSRVKVLGLREEEIHLILNEEKLKRYKLSKATLIERIQDQNSNLSAGLLYTTAFNARVRTRGQAISPSHLLDMPIEATADGYTLRLRDIARIEPAFRRSTQLRQRLGSPARILAVQKLRGHNALELVPKVKQRAQEVLSRLPDGLEISYDKDSTMEIDRNLNVLVDNLKQGVLLVFGLLWAVLGFGNSILAVIGIPIGFLSGLLFMREWGYSINGVSIFSMVIVSGMVVDDAIVILENIAAHKERGKSIVRAALDGTREVLWPVLSSAATTIAAFLPMVIMTGEIGRIMVVIPITVTIILIASLLEAFLILPCHAVDVHELATLLQRKNQKPLAHRLFVTLEAGVTRWIQPILHRPGKSILLMTTILVVIAAIPPSLGRLRVILFPSDSRSFLVDLSFQSQFAAKDTAQACTPMEKLIEDELDGLALNIMTQVGQQIDESYEQVRGEHLAQIRVSLPNELPDGTTLSQVLQDTEKRLRTDASPALKRVRVRRVPDGPRLGRPVAVRLQHPNRQTLLSLSEKVIHLLEQEKGLIEPSTNLVPGKPQIDVLWFEDKLLRLGLSENLAGLALALQTDGFVASVLHWNSETVELRVRSDRKPAPGVAAWMQTPIDTPEGDSIPLQKLARVDIRPGYATLPRWEEEKSILIGALLDPDSRRTAVAINASLLPKIKNIVSQVPGANFKLGGEFEESQKSLNSLKDAFLIAAITMFLILAAQFKSLTQPLLILLVIPYTFLGVIFGMGILDQPFTMLSMIAMVGLAGMVVNGNIVLLDFMNQALERGTPLQESVLQAVQRRIRPVVLTTLSTIAGLLPTALGLGGKSIVWQPMAITICFGILTSMGIILVVMPCLFLIHAQKSSHRLSRRDRFLKEESDAHAA